MRRRLLLPLMLLVGVCTPATALGASGDIARYVLPPGNFGGIPTSPHSLDSFRCTRV